MSFIQVKNLGKAYKRYRNKYGRFLEWLKLGNHHELRWVLRSVTFDVEPGEALAIVGDNGAGKSTLLKITAGVVRPTTGTVVLGGRVAALLELGTGFHPEFTGRENAYLSGQLKGLTRHEMDAAIREIEDFAEIGDYFDQPLRTYSSGMEVRLAFAVATAIRPDILIVDETLSVGDIYFQHKSFDRIRKFRDAGTTLLFVSHSPAAVKTLCDRALLMERGIVVRDGPSDDILNYYNAIIAKDEADYKIREEEQRFGAKTIRSGNGHATIEVVDLLSRGNSVRALKTGDPATVRIRAICHKALDELTVGILIRDRLGNDVFGTNTFYHNLSYKDLTAGEILVTEFRFPSLWLGVGTYSVTVALHRREAHPAGNYDWVDRALVFQVVPSDAPPFIGVCNLCVDIHRLDPGAL